MSNAKVFLLVYCFMFKQQMLVVGCLLMLFELNFCCLEMLACFITYEI